MSVIWYKVLYDLWRNKARTILTVISISAGVFAVGAMFGMSDQLLSGMDAAHQAVNPSHVNMFFDTRIDRSTADALRHVNGVEDVQPYNQVTVRYKTRPAQDWQQGSMMMLDDYTDQKYDVIQLKSGHWPKREDIGIERLSAQFFKLNIGDKVTFKIGNIEKVLPISGLIRHPFVPPPQFGGPAYFFVNAEGLERFDVPQNEFGALLFRVLPYSEGHAHDVASAIKGQLSDVNVGVAAAIYQNPTKHWGRIFIEGFTLVLQVLAVISLFSSVILVYNTLSALITQQTNQIGILKAIGGRSTTIVKVYLSGVFVYGALAFFISLPLGAFVAFWITQLFLNLFNIDYAIFRWSTQAIILQIICALFVPLIAALVPVLSGANATVRQAISTYGLGADFGSNSIDRFVERVGQLLLPSHYATALGNMFRRKARLIMTQLVLVMAGVMFLMVMSLSSSIDLTVENIFSRRQYDITMSLSDLPRIDRVVEAAMAIKGVEKAEVRSSTSATILLNGTRANEAGVGLTLSGVPDGSDFFTPFMVGGRWLQKGDGRVLVVARETADKNNIKIGDTITLDLGKYGDDNWNVVGLYEPVFAGGLDSDTVYGPQSAVFEATKKYYRGGLLYVRTGVHNEAAADAITTDIKAEFERRNLKVFASRTEYEIRRANLAQFSLVTTMLLLLAVIVAVVGGISLMGALSISVVERTKEIGVLRAVGARSRTILGMFLMEGLMQGVLSWLIALPISFFLSQPLASALGQVMFSATLDYQFNFVAVIVWLIIILVISALASILPARGATRISVRDSLAYA